jgi:hypothetical protein
MLCSELYNIKVARVHISGSDKPGSCAQDGNRIDLPPRSSQMHSRSS